MTESNEPKENSLPEPSPDASFPWRYFSALLIVGAFFAVWFVAQQGEKEAPAGLLKIEQQMVETSARIGNVVARLEKLEQEFNSLSEALGAGEAEEEDSGTKGEVSALSAEVKSLQAQLKQTEQSRSAEQANLATVMAFTQLSSIASTGENFSRELEALRARLKGDVALLEDLKKLEPLAVSGVPNIQALREQFNARFHEAQVAALKANAQDWKARVKVAMQGLVSIRPLHSDAPEEMAYKEIDDALSRHDLVEAVNKVNLLPQAAQEVLKDWRSQLESRRNLESVLDEMSMRLVPQKDTTDTTSTMGR